MRRLEGRAERSPDGSRISEVSDLGAIREFIALAGY
jgi:hypothetical protein